MTTFSTTLALGFVPFNMFIYTISFTDESIEIPYLEMFLTVLYTWVAALLGLSIGWKLPKVGYYISRVRTASDCHGKTCGVSCQKRAYVHNCFSVSRLAWGVYMFVTLVQIHINYVNKF